MAYVFRSLLQSQSPSAWWLRLQERKIGQYEKENREGLTWVVTHSVQHEHEILRSSI